MAHDPLVRVSDAAKKAAKARSELEEAIIAAQVAGHSLREIAELAGIGEGVTMRPGDPQALESGQHTRFSETCNHLCDHP